MLLSFLICVITIDETVTVISITITAGAVGNMFVLVIVLVAILLRFLLLLAQLTDAVQHSVKHPKRYPTLLWGEIMACSYTYAKTPKP